MKLILFLQDKQVCSYCTDTKADTADMTLMKTCSFKAGSCNEVINLGKNVFRYGRDNGFHSRVRNKRTPLNKHSPWNICQKQ